MYKVVIIDDEPLIVEGLSRTMSWEKWNCQVAGSAYNGKEGMDIIRKERPHIIISDINMPKLDGLKMIAALKSEFPHMQLIILTGYREFEYAREAISLGVARFLLKPSKMNELEEAMEEVTRRLAQSEERSGIYPGKLPGKTAFDGCSRPGLCQSMASVQAAQQAYRQNLFRSFEQRPHGESPRAVKRPLSPYIRRGGNGGISGSGSFFQSI